MSQNDWKQGDPARQGFYRVRTDEGTQLIAEWREHQKGEGKKWWQWVTDDPTVQKQPAPLSGVIGYAPASKTEVEALLRRELTRDEKIQRSYESFQQFKGEWLALPQPERRRLSIGQPVELGRLESPVVVALHDNGQLATIEYREVKREHGKEIPAGLAYTTRHWLDLMPVRETTAAPMVIDRHSINYLNTDLDSIVNRYYATGMRADTKYQRGYVWTQADKDLLIDSLVRGKEIGRFIFVRNPYPHPDDVLDGKQRLDALIGFFSSQFPYKGVYWDEMSRRDRHAIEGKGVQYADLNAEMLGEVALLEIFLDVNAAGVPQTKEHLAYVEKLLEEARAHDKTKKGTTKITA